MGFGTSISTLLGYWTPYFSKVSLLTHLQKINFFLENYYINYFIKKKKKSKIPW
jgi:hypothetical protein